MQIKTSIAPIIVVILGVISFILSTMFLIESIADRSGWGVFILYISIGFFINGLFLLIPSIFVLRKKKWAIDFLIYILFLEILIILLSFQNSFILFYQCARFLILTLCMVSFLILIIQRKNI